jgi:hypothetical protein
MIVNKIKLITSCIVLIALCLAFSRDWILEKGGTPDLRNRVVGARLQKDGKAPYFYKWYDGGPIRYYDISNIGTEVSSSSASPFFHTLLYPIAEYPQRTISHIWLFIEYLFLIITGILAYRLTKNNIQAVIVSIAFILFLFTEAWKNHIYAGQIYIILPFLCMVIYYCLTRRENPVAAFIAGLAAISLILIRPNTIVFLFPFLFLVNTYSRKYLAILIIPVILLPAAYFSFENNRNYWKEYSSALPASMKVHQGPNQKDKKVIKRIGLQEWEGWKEIEKINYKLHSEHGNIFVLYQTIFKKRLSVRMMHFLSGFSIVILLSLYYWTRKKYDSLQLTNIAILAFCLYMISDLFSPIWRHQYYTIQWLFPVLVAATVYKPALKWLYGGLLMALLLNIINTGYLKMEHTIGEYLILLLLLYMSLMKNLKDTPDLFAEQKDQRVKVKMEELK